MRNADTAFQIRIRICYLNSLFIMEIFFHIGIYFHIFWAAQRPSINIPVSGQWRIPANQAINSLVLKADSGKAVQKPLNAGIIWIEMLRIYLRCSDPSRGQCRLSWPLRRTLSVRLSGACPEYSNWRRSKPTRRPPLSIGLSLILRTILSKR